MSKKRRLIGLWCVAVLCSQGLCAQSRPMGLEELFRLADEQSKRIQTYRTGTEAADEALKAAKAQRLPDVNVSLSASYWGNGKLWDRDFGHARVIDMPHFGNNFALEAQQVIYAGGAISSGIRQVELGKLLAELDLRKNVQEIRFLLAGHYLNLYKLDNQIRVLRKNLELTEEIIAHMHARREQGTVLKNDITRYELQKEQLRLQLSRVSDARKIANHQLVTTLHLPEEVEISPDASLLEQRILTLAEEDWQEMAKANHILLKQTEATVQMNEQKVRQERAERLPHISIIAADHLDGPITIEVPVLDNNFNYWYVGVGVKYNLSSLFKNNRKLKQARLNVQYTDNAQVKQHITPVNTRVQGFIKKICFEEYKPVHKGDTLLVIEDAEFKLRLAQAEADLANAQAGQLVTHAGIATMQNNLMVNDAGIEEARVQRAHAEREWQRYKKLLEEDAVTRQQYDQVQTVYEAANARYEQMLRMKHSTSLSKDEQMRRLGQNEAAIRLAQAAVDLARLNLSYTVIIATCDGVTGRKDIHEGQLIQPGQTVVDIVDDSDLWVIANYRETQLPNIREGAEVSFTADAVPGVVYRGVVESISDATGAAFSLIPQDNATGNFVKVEQRVPVRIRLQGNDADQVSRLRAGLNVECKVKY